MLKTSRIRQNTSKRGFGKRFKMVSEAAQEVGHPTFPSADKLLSKFAHPTALAIDTVTSVEADEGYRLNVSMRRSWVRTQLTDCD